MACDNLTHTISFSNNTPLIGETVTCTATVTNTGTTTEQFHVNFSQSGLSPFSTSTVKTIAPGATVQVAATFQGTVATTVNICADLVCDTAPVGNHTIAGVQMFPADSIFNTQIDKMPVHASSSAWLASQNWNINYFGDYLSIGGGQLFRGFDNGTGGHRINIVTNATSTMRTMKFRYPHQSDFCYGIDYAYYLAHKDDVPAPFYTSSMQYSLPTSPTIESGADKHCYVLNTDTKKLYEMFTLYTPIDTDGTYHAHSGAAWDVSTNNKRGESPGTTHYEPLDPTHRYPLPRASSAAGGLPICSMMVTYEEYAATGKINHALCIAIPWTHAAYLYPASGYSGTGDTHNGYETPPMGACVRLKASVDLSGFMPQSKAILTALQKYGAYINDNAYVPYTNAGWHQDKRCWWIWGFNNPNWNMTDIGQINTLTTTSLEFADISSIIPDKNSYRALQS